VRINSKTLTYIGKHSIYYYLGHYIIIYTLFNYVCHYPLILTILAFATPTAISLIVSKAQYNKKIIY
jgi:fucose 4-O-acetylase-like acetyltransferase